MFVLGKRKERIFALFNTTNIKQNKMANEVTNERVMAIRRELKKKFPRKDGWSISAYKYSGLTVRVYESPYDNSKKEKWAPGESNVEIQKIRAIISPQPGEAYENRVDFFRGSYDAGRYHRIEFTESWGDADDYPKDLTPKPEGVPVPKPKEDEGENKNKEEKMQDDKTSNMLGDMLRLDTSMMGKILMDKIDKEVKSQVTAEVDNNRAVYLQEVTIQIKDDVRKVRLSDKHSSYLDCLKILRLYKKLLMVGEKGSGKSTIARQLSSDLKLPFASYSCNIESTKSELVGYMGVTEYIQPSFLDIYEGGGIFFVDEYDAMPAAVSIVLNAAIDDSPEISVPTRIGKTVAKKHDDFYIVFAGNTYGSISMDYSARENQDAAFMDRLMISKVEIGYDDKLERSIFNGSYDTMMKLRKAHTDTFGSPLSTRNLVDIDTLMRSGENISKVVDVISLGKTESEKKTFVNKTMELKTPKYEKN